MPIKRRHGQKRADEDDSHRRAVERLKQNIHRSTTRASTSSFCLARWPHPSATNVCLLTALPGQSSQPTRQQNAVCRPQFKRPSLYPPAPSTCSAVRFTRAVPIALPLGCLGCLAAGQHCERDVPSWPGCRSTWAGAPAYGGLVLCLCATLTIATEVPGTRRFRQVGHVSEPSLSRGSIAKKNTERGDPSASAVEQARYSSELRTDGAGSVTPSGSHRASHARTVRIEASLS